MPAVGMLDLLRGIDRLLSHPDFSVRKFVCLTDDPSYAKAHCPRGAGRLKAGGGGKGKGRGRGRPAAFAEDIEFEWSNYKQWYFLSINL